MIVDGRSFPSCFSYDQVHTSTVVKLSSLTRISSETQAILDKGYLLASRVAVSFARARVHDHVTQLFSKPNHAINETGMIGSR
jgi:hypothetical protein